jgi:hypothetical protein
VEIRSLTAVESATLVKLYVEQAASPNGMSVDALPYTDAIQNMAAGMRKVPTCRSGGTRGSRTAV